MRKTAAALVLCFASLANAQGRGGRSGGPGPMAPLCVNQDAIESMEIVKGPAAAQAYGPKAANGVVVMYLKAGQTSALGGCPAAPPMAPSPGADPIGRYFFPPDLVLSHQDLIDLSDKQRADIQSVMKEAQSKFVDLQVQMSGELEKLQSVLRAKTIDEKQMLDAADKLMASENAIKHQQLMLMERTRNVLNDQQQATLKLLKGLQEPDDRGRGSLDELRRQQEPPRQP